MKNRPLIVVIGILSLFLGGCGDSRQQPASVPSKVDSKLQWFQLEVADDFRIGVGAEKPGLISYKPMLSTRGETFIFYPDQNRTNYELIFRSLEALIDRLHIMNMPEHEPQKAFEGIPPRSVAAIHIGIAYGGRTWSSWYQTNEIPPKIQAFYEGCRDLSIEVCERGAKQEISPKDALKIADKLK